MVTNFFHLTEGDHTDCLICNPKYDEYSDEEWVESQLPVPYTDVVDLLEPVMKRIGANTGAYAGNYPADAARRVVDTITKAGWVIKRK